MKKKKEMDSSHGLMVDAIKVNGKMVNKMVVEFFEIKQELKKKVNGLPGRKLNGLTDKFIPLLFLL